MCRPAASATDTASSAQRWHATANPPAPPLKTEAQLASIATSQSLNAAAEVAAGQRSPHGLDPPPAPAVRLWQTLRARYRHSFTRSAPWNQ